MDDTADLDSILPSLPAPQLEKARWFMEQVGAADVHYLPNTRIVVLHFEDQQRYQELSDDYDADTDRREKAVEFFCRVLNTTVEDVRLSGIFRVDDENDGAGGRIVSVNRSDITVYGAHWCSDCRRAKQFLDEQQVAHKWIDVDHDPKALQYVREVNHGMQIIPTIVFQDGSTLVEPSNAELAAKLGIQRK